MKIPKNINRILTAWIEHAGEGLWPNENDGYTVTVWLEKTEGMPDPIYDIIDKAESLPLQPENAITLLKWLKNQDVDGPDVEVSWWDPDTGWSGGREITEKEYKHARFKEKLKKYALPGILIFGGGVFLWFLFGRD